MDEIARLTPTFTGVSFDKIDELGSVQWPCNDEHPKARRRCTSASSCAARASSSLTEYVPTTREGQREVSR